jgi:hypothetical protein
MIAASIMIIALTIIFTIGLLLSMVFAPRKKAYLITYGLFTNTTTFVTARSPQKAVAKFYRKYGRNWEIRKIEEMDW